MIGGEKKDEVCNEDAGDDSIIERIWRYGVSVDRNV